MKVLISSLCALSLACVAYGGEPTQVSGTLEVVWKEGGRIEHVNGKVRSRITLTRAEREASVDYRLSFAGGTTARGQDRVEFGFAALRDGATTRQLWGTTSDLRTLLKHVAQVAAGKAIRVVGTRRLDGGLDVSQVLSHRRMTLSGIVKNSEDGAGLVLSSASHEDVFIGDLPLTGAGALSSRLLASEEGVHVRGLATLDSSGKPTSLGFSAVRGTTKSFGALRGGPHPSILAIEGTIKARQRVWIKSSLGGYDRVQSSQGTFYLATSKVGIESGKGERAGLIDQLAD